MESLDRTSWRWRGSMEPLDNRPDFVSETNGNQIVAAKDAQGIDSSPTNQRNANELVKDTLLIISVQDAIECLSAHFERVARNDENGNRPVTASRRTHFEPEDLLLRCCVQSTNINHVNILEKSLLMFAKLKDVSDDPVPHLIVTGANVNCVNALNDSPLILACAMGNITHVKLLLEAGAKVEYPGKDGDTPLIHAARRGHTHIVQLLLESGADIDGANTHMDTPLLCAAQYKKVETVIFLLQEGASVNHVNKSGETALMQAVCKRSLDITRELIHAGAEVNAVDYLGNNALINAARLDEAKIMTLLIESGAFLNQVNVHNKSALWFAVCHSVISYSPCLRLLLASGACIGSELHQAVTVGLMHVVKVLVEHGATPRLINLSQLSIRSFPVHIQQVSPLTVALLTQRLDIARNFMDIGFLTDFDLRCLPYDDKLKCFLKDNAKSESVNFMNNNLAGPWSLERFCLIVISKNIGFQSKSRKLKVESSGLPRVFQKLLLS
uniref:Uncharacterized protein n=2 Tax=Biomphalaria glabrata TaxID=6526 RepID=A0A2C9JV72_BIOGL